MEFFFCCFYFKQVPFFCLSLHHHHPSSHVWFLTKLSFLYGFVLVFLTNHISNDTNYTANKTLLLLLILWTIAQLLKKKLTIKNVVMKQLSKGTDLKSKQFLSGHCVVLLLLIVLFLVRFMRCSPHLIWKHCY